MNKKFLYSLLIIVVLETLFLVWVFWPFYAYASSLFDLLLVFDIIIINIILGVVLVIPKVTRPIALSFFLCSIIMPVIYGGLLEIRDYSFNYHIFSDDVVYNFIHKGEVYQLELHDKNFEEFLDKQLSPEEKKVTDMKNVFEIVRVTYNDKGKKERWEIASIGNYKQVGKNEYVFNRKDYSAILSLRNVPYKGVHTFPSSDTLVYKLQNDSLFGPVDEPLKLQKIYDVKEKQ